MFFKCDPQIGLKQAWMGGQGGGRGSCGAASPMHCICFIFVPSSLLVTPVLCLHADPPGALSLWVVRSLGCSLPEAGRGDLLPVGATLPIPN